MGIMEIRCEKCGHTLRAAPEAAGRRTLCPFCKNSIYIPVPPEEIEELPLAPEDEAFLRREAALEEERRRLDRALAREWADEATPADGGTGLPRPVSGPSPHPVGAGRTSIAGVVMTFLEAMRDSDLNRAEQAARLLATHREETLAIIDRLAADQIPPVQMTGVPPAVYQGFLRALRSRL